MSDTAEAERCGHLADSEGPAALHPPAQRRQDGVLARQFRCGGYGACRGWIQLRLRIHGLGQGEAFRGHPGAQAARLLKPEGESVLY